MIYCYLAVAGAMAVLAVLAKGEPLCSEEPVAAWLRPFRRIAVFLYRRFLDARSDMGRRNRHFPGRETVRRDLVLLEPSGRTGRRLVRYYIDKIQKFLLCLALGDCLAAAVWYTERQDSLIQNQREIDRPAAGEASVDVRVTAAEKGAGNRSLGEYTVEISAQEYSEEETATMAEELFDVLPDTIRGENNSLLYVTKDLDLPEEVPGYPFRIRWDSSSYEFINTDGAVGSDRLGEGAHQNVTLTAALSYRGRHYEKTYEAAVYPRVRTETEQMEEAMAAALSERDAATAEDTRYYLPEAVNGIPIVWEEQKEDSSLLLFGVLLAAGIAVFILSDRDLHHRVEERERQMALDYPQIVGKMVLLVGAGVSIRNAFIRIGDDYLSSGRSAGEKRYVYEEILLMCREMQSGISEGEALLHFGKRCGSGRYSKFCSLLSQNQRKGNAVLLQALQEEADQAFLDRKNIARQLGEEAGTKLLFPMVLMLAVTLVIIMIPAYSSFSL